MPVSAYFKGHGDEVMSNMVKEYGSKKGKSVFYATANSAKRRPPPDTDTPKVRFERDMKQKSARAKKFAKPGTKLTVSRYGVYQYNSKPSTAPEPRAPGLRGGAPRKTA